MSKASVTSTLGSNRRLPAAQLEKLQHFAELGRLSASLLHEISNPLTAAILELEQYALQPRRGIRHAQHSLKLIRRYVEAARQQVRAESIPTSFSIKPQVDQVRRLVSPLARSAGIQLVIDNPPVCRLYGDAVKLQQILNNLIVNAIDAYRDDAAPGLARPVHVQFRISNRLLIIKVIDWGSGIAAEQLPRLFEPFYTTKLQPGRYGLGIGLALVRRVVADDFGGIINVTSSRRHGTQFTVKLPLANLITHSA